jgi:hypothetical protein
MIAGLQPLLLGTLARESRITAVQLGHAATAELLIMGVVCGYAGARWPTEHLRVIGAGSALLLAALDVMTTFVHGEGVTLVRALAGVPSAVMIWITIAMIARSPTPERWSGIYLTLQTLAQFVAAAALTAWVVGDLGANGGFIVLAILSCVAAVAAWWLPNRLVPLAAVDAHGNRPGSLGLLALTVPLLWMAFVVGVWVYAEPLSHQAGHRPNIAGIAITASLACQVLGGATATLVGGRLRWFPTLCSCAALNAVCLLVFAALPHAVTFLGASAVFGFLWLFTLPFMVPMVIAADPTRRAAVMVGGAELLGGSLGPLLVSFVVSDTEARGAIGFGGLALGAAVLIMFALQRHERSTPASIEKDS